MTDLEQLEQAIADLEAQRDIRGDSVVEATLGLVRRELTELGQTTEGIVEIHQGLTSLQF